MEAMAVLGALMGLAFVSGLRLYSTVLAIGLGIRFGYLVIPPHLTQLQILAQTSILMVAGVVYIVEFFADKVPWVDSVWDAVHTFIRPIGAAVLAATAVGDVDPVVKLGAVLLCGGIALSSHSAKAGTRILANHSPEPFTNVGLSLGEDVLVAGGVWLALKHPLVSLVLVVVAVGFIIWLVPKIFRLVRRQATKVAAFAKARLGRVSAAPHAGA
jgi:hypothetical protein